MMSIPIEEEMEQRDICKKKSDFHSSIVIFFVLFTLQLYNYFHISDHDFSLNIG